MDMFTAKQLREMQESLQQIAEASENILQQAERSCRHIQERLSELRTYILSYTFRDETEEVRFFKEIKPLYVSEWMYYKELFQIEAHKPSGDASLMIAYYKESLQSIHAALTQHHNLYIYYKTGRSDLDKRYFIRANSNMFEFASPELDPQFSTTGSNALSGIIAWERITDYIGYQIRTLQYGPSLTNDVSDVALPWTDKKAGLIELMYGLQAVGCLNNAQTELKQIARLFEMAFHIDLGNYTKVFQEIVIRKKNRTAFIDRLRDMLLKRMDEAVG